MKDFDFNRFYLNIQDDFTEIERIIGEVDSYLWEYQMRLQHDQLTDWDIVKEEENNFNEKVLSDMLKAVKAKLQFAFEYLGTPILIDFLESDLTPHAERYGDVSYLQYAGVSYSPVQFILNKYLEAIVSHVHTNGNIQSERMLERILRGTPKMIFDRKLVPTREKEVQDEVYRTLIHVFPDTVREIPISKISKSYKPDIGIKSLKCAIEYKFVDSELDAKNAIGGVFEDILGYEGSEDWKVFYAVFYMTAPFMTQDQVDAEFIMSKAPNRWKPIVVYGEGQRIVKASRVKPSTNKTK